MINTKHIARRTPPNEDSIPAPLAHARTEPGCSSAVNIPKYINETKFTVVMPTFNREKTLKALLEHYLKMPLVDKIILVWFRWEGNVPKPEDIVSGSLAERLIVKQMREDNLMLRFTPFTEIDTEGEYSLLSYSTSVGVSKLLETNVLSQSLTTRI